ncbi:hypothetical protein EDC56_0864 [Sinobacterium caligoides]|uniref:Uncharacterized protein n=1 Tax=Sinobacterium caligoides TaxID=933926 RepID=A0A3N2DZS1_9GAMM|nr:hypothetical protein [Sinobacterium caligoides]ROS05334.1 hypothetical protein EDC56_0864 [Sinobacterium caligoides]
MKPATNTAMRQLITTVRSVMPFSIPIQELCSGTCRGCAKKLLEYLDTELSEWEARLDDGESPGFNDLRQLTKTSRKIHAALVRNGLIEEP